LAEADDSMTGKAAGLIKWSVVERMVWAWIFTIPVSGLIAYGLVRALRWAGMIN
jgi:PiT family inorganic phosphate transporter